MSISSNEYNRNYKVNLYKQYRICPNCGKEMSFYIEGNFGGALGVFECNCGYKDKSVENISYATSEDWDSFWKETEDIMF